MLSAGYDSSVMLCPAVVVALTGNHWQGTGGVWSPARRDHVLSRRPNGNPRAGRSLGSSALVDEQGRTEGVGNLKRLTQLSRDSPSTYGSGDDRGVPHRNASDANSGATGSPLSTLFWASP